MSARGQTDRGVKRSTAPYGQRSHRHAYPGVPTDTPAARPGWAAGEEPRTPAGGAAAAVQMSERSRAAPVHARGCCSWWSIAQTACSVRQRPGRGRRRRGRRAPPRAARRAAACAISCGVVCGCESSQRARRYLHPSDVLARLCRIVLGWSLSRLQCAASISPSCEFLNFSLCTPSRCGSPPSKLMMGSPHQTGNQILRDRWEHAGNTCQLGDGRDIITDMYLRHA